MARSRKLIGSLFAFLSAVAVSLVYITSKAAQQTMETRLFMFWWFAFATLWAIVILIVNRRDFLCYLEKIRIFKWFFLYFALSEAFASFLFFYTIKQVNPAIVSFIGSLTPLFVAVIAFFYIQERLSPREISGGLISIAGVVLITYVSPDINIAYTLLVLLMVTIFSFNNVLVKKKIADVPPILISLVRIFFLMLTYLGLNLALGGMRLPDAREFWPLLSGSFLGPIMGMTFLFSALQHIKSTQASLIKNSQPFLVVVFSYLFLQTGVSLSQLWAGCLIVIGISLMISPRRLDLRAILNRFVKN
ncbi:MAG: DMT family transporter [Acidobacteriota bacterium]|jgi:drug/metabolite transporter (DMT)-like permease|nr:DMT family transporter [Acidobacteriota bacterium]